MRTENIFKNFDQIFSTEQKDLPDIETEHDFYNFITEQKNDLLESALQMTPDIEQTF